MKALFIWSSLSDIDLIIVFDGNTFVLSKVTLDELATEVVSSRTSVTGVVLSRTISLVFFNNLVMNN